MNPKLLKSTIILLIILVILFFAREILYLNWTIWWFDSLLHLLSGIFIGMVVFLIAQKFVGVEMNSLKVFFVAIAGAFVIGILWEIYELNAGHTSLSDGIYFALDTASDLIMDVCGGILGALYASKVIK